MLHLLQLSLAVPEAVAHGFRKHFSLLNVGSPLQNAPAPPGDPSSDKVLELVIGLALARMGASVELDDPKHAKGDNPDVLAEINGETWGFACKAISGNAPGTLIERIEDGIEQIQVSRATRGIVVLTFKNRFDHDSLLDDIRFDESGTPVLEPDQDEQFAVKTLASFVRSRLQAMITHVTQHQVDAVFHGKKALPGVLVVVQTTAILALPAGVAPPGMTGAPAPSRIAFLQLVPLEAAPSTAFDDSVKVFFEHINQALHT